MPKEARRGRRIERYARRSGERERACERERGGNTEKLVGIIRRYRRTKMTMTKRRRRKDDGNEWTTQIDFTGGLLLFFDRFVKGKERNEYRRRSFSRDIRFRAFGSHRDFVPCCVTLTRDDAERTRRSIHINNVVLGRQRTNGAPKDTVERVWTNLVWNYVQPLPRVSCFMANEKNLNQALCTGSIYTDDIYK